MNSWKNSNCLCAPGGVWISGLWISSPKLYQLSHPIMNPGICPHFLCTLWKEFHCRSPEEKFYSHETGNICNQDTGLRFCHPFSLKTCYRAFMLVPNQYKYTVRDSWQWMTLTDDKLTAFHFHSFSEHSLEK